MKPVFFETPNDFRHWLERNHAAAKELLVGFYKKGSGKPSITWPESVDEALAFGWIDGVRRSRGADSYTIRFTPRKLKSVWSAVNIKRVAELTAAGRMTEAGLTAFAAADEKRSATYSYEREAAAFDAVALAAFKAEQKAWTFYNAQAPYYVRLSTFWVMSAKKPETRSRRLAILIDCSRSGKRLPALSRTKP